VETGVGVEIGVGVETGVGIGVGVATCEGVKEGEGDTTGDGVTRTTTPRLQTLLFPRLTQVNSRFLETTTAPTFLHDAPARGVLADALVSELRTRKKESKKTKTRRICEF
jgi:hypothetical protein